MVTFFTTAPAGWVMRSLMRLRRMHFLAGGVLITSPVLGPGTIVLEPIVPSAKRASGAPTESRSAT